MFNISTIQSYLCLSVNTEILYYITNTYVKLSLLLHKVMVTLSLFFFCVNMYIIYILYIPFHDKKKRAKVSEDDKEQVGKGEGV